MCVRVCVCVCVCADVLVMGPLLDAFGCAGLASRIVQTVSTAFMKCKGKTSDTANALMSDRVRQAFLIAACAQGNAMHCAALLAGGKRVSASVLALAASGDVCVCVPQFSDFI